MGDLASFLATLPDEARARFSRYAAVDLPREPEDIVRTLAEHAAQNPATTASGLLATTGARKRISSTARSTVSPP